MFTVALKSNMNLPLTAYWVFTRNLDLQDMKEYALGDITPVEPREVGTLFEQMKRQLNAYSKGLLEAKRMQNRPYIAINDTITSERDWLDYPVEFLHRSVRDFLASSDISSRLLTWNSEGPYLDAIICSASLIYLKMSPTKLRRPPECSRAVLDSFLVHCKALYDMDSSQSNIDLSSNS
jgi:hypothetical protein